MTTQIKLLREPFLAPSSTLILVTGASGHIASNIVREALSLGYKVRGTARTSDKCNKTVAEHHNNPNYSTAVVSDYSHPSDEIDAAVKGVDSIIHVASDTTFSEDADHVIGTVVAGTENFLRAAAKEPKVKRFTLTSSSSAAMLSKPGVEGIVATTDTWNDEAVEAAKKKGTTIGLNFYAYIVYAASKTQGERAFWNFVKNEKPSFVANAVLPDFNTGRVVGSAGATGTFAIQLVKEGNRAMIPQYFIDVVDDYDPSAKKKEGRDDTMPKSNSRRLDKDEKNVLLHLLQAPKLTNCDIARILKVDERTISRRRKQLRTLGHLSPERNVKGAEKLHEWQLERVIALLDENPDLQLKDIKDFLQTEYDLTVTVSTISRQLSRANHARARRPGYKGKRPDLQPLEPPLSAQDQPQHAFVDAAVVEQPRQSQPQAATDLQSADALQQERPLMLKCPYFAANPQRYMSHPFCQSAWPTARDAKDHVVRQHSVPRFRCNRCMDHFDDNTALILHHRAQEPCPLREWVVPEGVDEEQKEKLRRIGQGEEVEKWKRIFRIIFPGLEDMPNHLFYEPVYFTAIDPALGALPQLGQAVGSAAVASTE